MFGWLRRNHSASPFCAPAPPAAAAARFDAAEALAHRSAADLERVSLDLVDESTGGQPPVYLTQAERIGAIVADVVLNQRRRNHP